MPTKIEDCFEEEFFGKKLYSSFWSLLLNIRQGKTPYENLARYYHKESNGGLLTVLSLMVIADNHKIGDHPEQWGIDSDSADRVRAFFSMQGPTKSVLLLRKHFPCFFDPESSQALKDYRVNLEDYFVEPLNLNKPCPFS